MVGKIYIIKNNEKICWLQIAKRYDVFLNSSTVRVGSCISYYYYYFE